MASASMKSTSSASMLSKSHNLLASPKELPMTLESYGSPAYSARYPSVEPIPSSHRLDCSPPATGPPKNMASLLSPPPSAPCTPPTSPPKAHAVPDLSSASDAASLYSNSPATPEVQYRQPEQVDGKYSLPRITVNDEMEVDTPALEKPKKEDYAIFVSAVMAMYNSNPRDWLKQQRRQLANIAPHYSANHTQKAAPVRARPIAPAPRSTTAGVVKPKQRVQRTPRATPKVRPVDTYDVDGTLLTPPNFRLVSKPKAPVSREDVDFDSIPDYCPPLSTLPNNKCLKTEWKGQALNLDNDPHRHLLHPAEILLASTLRLSCASYLTSKRRIFQEKVTRTRNGQEFRKTDSQKACKIDVNKASKLWAAFDRVGWFDRKYIEKHL